MKLSLVVPVYNEAENIQHLHHEIMGVVRANQYSAEIIYVDDGSKDGSLAVLKKIAESTPEVKVISFRRNFGQTAAISAGFQHATGDVVIPMDGDGQNDPADLPKFLAKIDEGFDVVSGWRKDRKDRAFRRKLPSRIANRIISWASGVSLHDYGCTMKAYRSDVIQGVRLYGEMHRFIPIYATWEGAKVTEIIANHRARTAGKSKYGINRTFKVMLDLLVIKFLEKYFSKPIYVFGGFAFVSFALSMICFAFMVYFKYWGDKTFIQTPLPALVVTFVMIGILSFMLGLVAEMVTRTYYESQGREAYRIRKKWNL